MEFDTDINSLLRDVVTKVDNRLQVCRSAGLRFPDSRLQLFDVVNKMGDASARAQGLAGAITTGRKLETSDHHLYIMKDPVGSRGHGAVIGILKIGRKRLFVYDRHGQQWEMDPLCVLDFYVHESQQRMGCGRRLFDFMLTNERILPQHLAVDRPSHKFASFLAKHYGLKDEIPQVNNFVIFDGFFTKRREEDFVNNRRNNNVVKPADYVNRGRAETNTMWQGDNYNNSKAYDSGNNHNHHQHRANTTVPPNAASRPSSSHRPNGTAAGLPSILPRHQSHQMDNSLKELNLNPRSAQNLHGSGNHSPKGLSDVELRSLSAGSSNRATTASNLQLQATMYSRHQTVGAVDSATANPHYSVAHRPPSGKKADGGDYHRLPPGGNQNVGKEKSPPLLQREGPPRDYLDSFNMHHNYQGRKGHLIVPSDPRVGLTQPSTTTTTTTITQNGNSANTTSIGKQAVNSARAPYSYRGGYYTNPTLHTNGDTSWTVFGVLRNQQQFSARHSGHSRLW